MAVWQTKEIIQQTAFATNNGTEVLFNVQKKEVAKSLCLCLTMKNVTFNNNFEKIRRYGFFFIRRIFEGELCPLKCSGQLSLPILPVSGC